MPYETNMMNGKDDIIHTRHSDVLKACAYLVEACVTESFNLSRM